MATIIVQPLGRGSDADAADVIDEMPQNVNSRSSSKRWYCAPCRCAWRWIAYGMGAALVITLVVLFIVQWTRVSALGQSLAATVTHLTDMGATMFSATGETRTVVLSSAPPPLQGSPWAGAAPATTAIVGSLVFRLPSQLSVDVVAPADSVGVVIVRDRAGLRAPTNVTLLEATGWTTAAATLPASTTTIARGDTICLAAMDRSTSALLVSACGIAF